MRTSCGLEYKVLDSNSAVLVGIGDCSDEHIIVPSVIRGYNVVGISEKAFCRTGIKSVSLPLSITYVSSQAFAWCRDLVEVKALNICEIGNRAFMGCDKLSNVSFGNKLEYIGDKAFAYCPSLTSVALPNSLKALGSSAFEGCANLCRICLSDNLSIIESGTFYACGSLCKVILPSKLEFINEYAFAYCSSIQEINIPTKTVINREAFFECNNLLKNGKAS